jgi:hypothetical protein
MCPTFWALRLLPSAPGARVGGGTHLWAARGPKVLVGLTVGRRENLSRKKRRRRHLTPDTFGFCTQNLMAPLQSVVEGVHGAKWESLAQEKSADGSVTPLDSWRSGRGLCTRVGRFAWTVSARRAPTLAVHVSARRETVATGAAICSPGQGESYCVCEVSWQLP